MGTVVAASLIDGAGQERPFPDLSAALLGRDDGLIELRYAYAPERIPVAWTDEGMWRWRSLLPLADKPIIYPLAVGGTPLLSSRSLRAVSGMPQLWLKDETRSPTGSNKDRATALVLEWALRHGMRTVTAASTGNVAVSLAVGAAATGMDARIFVPATVNPDKLRLMLLAGATVFAVEEGYDAAVRLSRQAARAYGWCDRNTGANPLTLEAKKTVAFEVWEQLERTMPDAVMVPVGDGATLSAMYKGFAELVACGVAERVPRIIGVQAEGCQPLKRAWEGISPQLGRGTIADGIAVTAPSNAATVVRDVCRSGGGFVAVSDDAILHAIRTLAAHSGILAEPAAAASYAGLDPALETGLIERGERVVVHITGSGLKTPRYLNPARGAHHVRGTLDEVERALGRRTETNGTRCDPAYPIH